MKITNSYIDLDKIHIEIEDFPTGEDWSKYGFENEPFLINKIKNNMDEIIENWDNTKTDCSRLFESNKDLYIFPLVDTSNVTIMKYMFASASNLTEIAEIDTNNVTDMSYMFYSANLLKFPKIDTSNVTNFNYMFAYDNYLTEFPVIDMSSATNIERMFYRGKFNNMTVDMVDNILQSLLTAVNYTGTKSLYYLGFYYSSSVKVNIVTIMSCPHYQEFINAGWTIGY